MSQAPGPEMSWAGSVSRPVVSKSLGLEMSRGQSLFAAGIVLELIYLYLHKYFLDFKACTSMSHDRLKFKFPALFEGRFSDSGLM